MEAIILFGAEYNHCVQNVSRLQFQNYYTSGEPQLQVSAGNYLQVNHLARWEPGPESIFGNGMYVCVSYYLSKPGQQNSLPVGCTVAARGSFSNQNYYQNKVFPSNFIILQLSTNTRAYTRISPYFYDNNMKLLRNYIIEYFLHEHPKRTITVNSHQSTGLRNLRPKTQ